MTASDTDFHDQLEQGMKRALVLMMIADDAIDDEEIWAIQRVYRNMMEIELSEGDIRAEASAAAADGRALREVLAGLADDINHDGKEAMISAAFMVAAMDGHVTSPELDLLAELGAALDMTPAQVQSVVEGLLSG